MRHTPITQKTRKPRGEYDYIIGKLTGIITLIKKKNLPLDEYLNRHIEDREYFRKLREENQRLNDLKKVERRLLKFNQLRDEQIIKLFKIIKSKHHDFSLVRIFRLTSEIFKARGYESITPKMVETVYWNHFR